MEGGVSLNIKLFDKNKHLRFAALEAFKEGLLTDTELILVSEHICNCESCAAVLADSFDENELVEAPLGFEEEIKSKIKKKKQSEIQFFFYSCRVALAACIALVFVFSGTLNFAENTKMEAGNIKPPNLTIVNSISAKLNSFSEKIINMEDLSNDKEKK